MVLDMTVNFDIERWAPSRGLMKMEAFLTSVFAAGLIIVGMHKDAEGETFFVLRGTRPQLYAWVTAYCYGDKGDPLLNDDESWEVYTQDFPVKEAA